VVDGNGDTTGNYTLTLNRLDGDDQSISYNQSITSLIDLPGDQDRYTFLASAEHDISIFLQDQASGTLTLELYKPDGSFVTDCYANGSCEIDMTLPNSSGQYTIVVDGNGDTTGNYTLTLNRLDGDDQSISYNQSITSLIDLPGDQDRYVFIGGTGQHVSILLQDQASGTLTLELYKPDGSFVTDCYANGSCEIDMTLPNSSGQYTIVVDGNGATTGDYTLTLSCLQNCPPEAPGVDSVSPDQGFSNFSNDINVYGDGFVNGAEVSLGSTVLTTQFIDSTHLYATVPPGLTAGVYDVLVTNPDGGIGILPDGYTVLDPNVDDDLFGYAHEFWTDPVAPREGKEMDLGLIVHRQGGTSTLTNVAVHFYEGTPYTGTYLGEGIIPLLSPNDNASTASVDWTPTAAGDYSIYAIIDPDNNVTETFEDNNVVTRTVTVLPTITDTTPPHVDSFIINDGAFFTFSRNVTFDTTASDPSPGTGVRHLYFIEYQFSLAAWEWVPVQTSGWLDYESARTDYPWQLRPRPGIKYVQAWAADGAGNISLKPGFDFICSIPISDIDTIWAGESRIYRFDVTAGQRLTAVLDPTYGDPDLYVWGPPGATGSPWISNKSTGTDEVSFIAPVTGVYQVEVYGYTFARYTLDVDITNSGGNININNVSATKISPATPIIPVNSEPNPQHTLPAAPPGSYSIFLPFVKK
ncbi:MAG: hypothetical protein DWQ04_12970, partial [Chloroflexi bacterium]